jgi:hypothetical protein
MDLFEARTGCPSPCRAIRSSACLDEGCCTSDGRGCAPRALGLRFLDDVVGASSTAGNG